MEQLEKWRSSSNFLFCEHISCSIGLKLREIYVIFHRQEEKSVCESE